MLFEGRFWPGIADGSVTLTFRRWRAPRAVAGRRHRTPAGMIEIDEVRQVDPAGITAADARRAGYPDPSSLVADLRGDSGDPVYRVAFHRAGEDPRTTLAEDAAPTDADLAELDRRLARLDAASRHGPWTAATLGLIERRPGARAGDLAAEVGRETAPFKLDVRKLKGLGLTLSLAVGYRLSPRGAAYRRACPDPPRS